MSETKGKLIATLNSVYDDGSFAEIIAIAVVEDEQEGELWFCENKPVDGTHVDYVLHKVSEVFAAHDLLFALQTIAKTEGATVDNLRAIAKAAIDKAKKDWA